MLSNISIGQYFPSDSWVHKLDPRTKILITMVFVIAIFMAKSLASYCLVIAFVVLSIILSKLPLKLLWGAIKPLWIIIVFTMGIHIFTTPGIPIVTYSFINIAEEGVTMGAQMGVRLLCLILFSSLLTFTTSPIRLTDGVESLLKPFRRIGVPAHELAMMMTIALRFIPTLLEETDRIMKAQTSRGADFESGNILARIKNMVPLLVPLFISAFRRADDLAIAMEARCYRGGEGRTRMKALAYGTQDLVAAGFVAILVLALVLMYVIL